MTATTGKGKKKGDEQMTEQQYYRVVVRHTDDGVEHVMGTYLSETKALAELEKLKAKIDDDKRYEIYPADDDREACLRTIGEAELAVERLLNHERHRRAYHNMFLRYCDDKFSDCCRRIIADLSKKADRLAEGDSRNKTVYSVWLHYHVDAKVVGMVNHESDGGFCVMGLFFASVYSLNDAVAVHHFSTLDECKSWLNATTAAAAEFEEAMKRSGDTLFNPLLELPKE